jgi:hypothetical protein
LSIPDRARRQFGTCRAAWSGVIPPHLYALLRIVYGALGLLQLVGLSQAEFWHPGELVGPAGRLHAIAAATGHADLIGDGLFWFGVAAYALMTLGLRSRAATACAYAFALLLPQWNLLPLSSAFQVHRAGLFCLLFPDSGAVWSVDAIRRGRDGGDQPRWPLGLLQLQIALVYFWSGAAKSVNASWQDGTALHYVLANDQFRRADWLGNGQWEAALSLLTYVTLFWELLFPLLVLERHTRRASLAFGIALHTGMAALLELGTFSAVMIGSYAAFLNPAAVVKRSWKDLL